MPMFMQRYAPQTYALMRMMTGFLFLWHGAQKLFSIPMPPPMQLPSFVIAIAGPIELVGGLLVMIGLFTSWAAFLCSGLMAFAYWMGHGTPALLQPEHGRTRGSLLLRVSVHLRSGIRYLERG